MTARPDSPNYTQIPNSILGNILAGNIVDPGLIAELKGSELKVLLAVYRLTFGFHQEERRASLQLVQDMTGLSKQSVLKAAEGLEDNYGLIERKKDGGVTLWKAMVNFLDNTECQAMVKKLDPDVKKLDNEVKKLDIHLRKKPRKKLKKKDNGASAPLPKKEKEPVPLSIQAYRSIARRYPDKATWQMIDEAIGTNEDDIEFWKEVVTAYIACGWNKINIKGMISFFETKRLPTTEPIKGNGAKPYGPNRQVANPTSETAERAQWLTEKFKQAGRGQT